MFLVLVSLSLVVAPMTSNGLHKGWRNKKGPRSTPTYEQVTPPAVPSGNASSDQDSEGSVGRRYAD